MIYLSASDIEMVVKHEEVVSIIEEAMRLYESKNFVQPDRITVTRGDTETYLYMPCFTDEMKGTKFLTLFSENAAKGVPTIQGLMMLNDNETGKVACMMDGSTLTAYRTGAVGSCGIKHTTPENVSKLGVVGTGVQGFYQCLYASKIRPIKDIYVFDIFADKAEDFASRVKAALPEVNVHVMATVCVEAGLVEMKEPYTDVVLDAPAGIIRTHVKVENKKATEVTITNVPSFVYKENLPLTIDGKEIVVDIVFAGNFFALVDASQFDFEIGAQNVSKFSKVGVKILDTIKETFPVKHPLLDITVVDHCEFYTKCPHEGADICNTVIFGAGQCDRSPCGTGTSSMLVKLHHMGKLKVGDSIVTESVIGSHFTGRIAQETTVGDFKAIVPQITGSAYITGVSTYLIDKDDPLKYGFQLG